MNHLKLFILLHYYRFRSFFIRTSKCKKISKSILYFENFPIENAGYQYRTKKWSEILEKEGYNVEIWTLFEDKDEFDRQRKTKPFSKFLIQTLKIRFKQVLKSKKFETVIVRRELLFYNDYGNLFLDKLLLKFHPNAILDFDDDLTAAKNQPKKVTNLYGRLIQENGNKFNDSLRLYKRFIVASNYLKEKVLKENLTINDSNINVIPTCVDYNKYPPKVYPEKIEKLAFGWIGGDHNYLQLRGIVPLLNSLAKEHEFKLIVIAGNKFESEAEFDVEFIPWSLDTEIKNLYKIDVGLMPLEDNIENLGKGGFKLIQYMGLGIVSVAQGLTINKYIVHHKINSFSVNNYEEWHGILKHLLQKKYNLKVLGKKARERVNESYTFNSNLKKYIKFIEECVE